MPKAVAMNTTKWWFACCQVTLGIYYPEILTSLSLSFAHKVRNLRSGSVVFLPQRGGSCVREHWFPGAAVRRICTNGAWQQKPVSKTLQWGGGGAATFRVVWSGNTVDFGGSALLDLAGVKSAGPADLCTGTDLPVTSDVVWQRTPLPAPVRAGGGPALLLLHGGHLESRTDPNPPVFLPSWRRLRSWCWMWGTGAVK